jgi:hypothetical protein
MLHSFVLLLLVSVLAIEIMKIRGYGDRHARAFQEAGRS